MNSIEEIKDYIKKDYELRNHHAFLFAYPTEYIHILIEPHLVCKETNRVEDDQSLNTTLQYWVEILIPQKIDWSIESSKWQYAEGQEFTLVHDYELDCGGYDYEEAILNAHKLLTDKYGETNEELYNKAMDERMKEFTTTHQNVKRFIDKIN